MCACASASVDLSAILPLSNAKFAHALPKLCDVLTLVVNYVRVRVQVRVHVRAACACVLQACMLARWCVRMGKWHLATRAAPEAVLPDPEGFDELFHGQ